MVNVKRLFSGIKYVLAFTAFTLNLFFWSLAEDLNIYFLIFISAVIASMDYGQAHLFDVMWKEKHQENDVKDLNEQIKVKSERLEFIKEQIDFLEPTYNEFIKVQEQCFCEECERMFASPQARNGHKCKKSK